MQNTKDAGGTARLNAKRKFLAGISILLLISTACYTLAPDTPLAETPTPTISWGGSWTIWEDVDPLGLPITLSQSGVTISGSFTDPEGHVVTVNGVLNADLASGTWEDTDNFSGTFEWQQINANQFIGNGTILKEGQVDRAFAWCGARNGASKPNPCSGP